VLVQINLKLIVVSSKTAEFLFTNTDTVAAITQHVFDNWPSGLCWIYDQVMKVMLTLINNVVPSTIYKSLFKT